ncbi:MAG: isocitrate/isopropylmalate dehydrogenase family protein [Deltaproteobacteria bacterium]|nr:isocitrate/isopropylmalate dehydrogenase family protein [Deltaproteobacteria bacterium]
MRVAVIPGDGIGTEVTAEATKVLETIQASSAVRLELRTFDYGADRFLRDGVTLPDAAIEEFRRDYRAILVGALGDPRVPDNRHARDILLGLRFKLDLYINLRPVVLLDRRLTPLRDKSEEQIRMICFRENTEGVYVGMGGNFKVGTADEVAINEDLNTRKGVERIQRAAFGHARAHGLRLCMSDKSNAMEYAHGLWRRVFAELRREYPEVEAEHLYADVLAMRMVQQPERFQVIVTSNLFGDLITDLGAGLVGGLGLAASANIHPGQVSLFEPVHGSAPDLAGKGQANPMGAILAAGMLLEYLGHAAEARRIEAAVRRALLAGETTADLGGHLSTREVGDRVAARLRDDGGAA